MECEYLIDSQFRKARTNVISDVELKQRTGVIVISVISVLVVSIVTILMYKVNCLCPSDGSMSDGIGVNA